MTIGSKVICLRLPEYGVGIVVDITKNGLLKIIFEDDYTDLFHPLEVDLASKFPTLEIKAAA
jgi:hypothetical protein